MKILIIDAFSEAHLEDFRKLGLTVDYQPGLKAEELPQAIGGATILVVSHDNRVVPYADQLFNLADGRLLVESGHCSPSAGLR